MLQNATYFTPKNANIFVCEYCDFKCCKSSDWNRHILTRKHHNATKMLHILRQKTPSQYVAKFAIKNLSTHQVCTDIKINVI